MGGKVFLSHPLDAFQSMKHCTLHAVQQWWQNTTSVWKAAKCSFTFARTKGENMAWSCKTCDPVLSDALVNEKHPSTQRDIFVVCLVKTSP